MCENHGAKGWVHMYTHRSTERHVVPPTLFLSKPIVSHTCCFPTALPQDYVLSRTDVESVLVPVLHHMYATKPRERPAFAYLLQVGSWEVGGLVGQLGCWLFGLRLVDGWVMAAVGRVGGAVEVYWRYEG